MYEWIGLIGTCFILLSFIFKKVNLIRAINLAGCIVFISYGVMIESLSTWLLNSLIAVIQIYYLIKVLIKRNKEKKQNDIRNKED